jgi:hypothetical protein
MCDELAKGSAAVGVMRVPRETAIDASTAVLHEFIDAMAEMCEVMPHAALKGDEIAAMFDLAYDSQMVHSEKRYYPAMHTGTSMHEMYVQHIADKYKEVAAVVPGSTTSTRTWRKPGGRIAAWFPVNYMHALTAIPNRFCAL